MATRSVSSYPTDAEVVTMPASRSQLFQPMQETNAARKNSVILDDFSLFSRWLLVHRRRMLTTAILFLAVCCIPLYLLAQNAPQTGRPVLFLPGFCASPHDWDTLAEQVAGAIAQPPFTIIIRSTWSTMTAQVSSSGLQVKTSLCFNPRERFFAIVFFDGQSYSDYSSPDPINVNKISVLNKADEIAQVIRAITMLTRVKDVNVVGHSLGGLDARAYMEDLAVSRNSAICSTSDGYHCLTTPKTRYGHDIHKLVTLDTPHGGAEIAANTALFTYFDSFIDNSQFPVAKCVLASTLNRDELEPPSILLQELNSWAMFSLPSDVSITAIRSHPGFLLPWDWGDDVVGTGEQSIENIVPSNPLYVDVENISAKNSCSPSVLHGLNCLQAQASTLTNIMSALQGEQVGTYTSIQVRSTLDGVAWSGPLHFTIEGPSSSIKLTDTGSGCSLPCSFSSTPVPTYYNVPTGEYFLNDLNGGPSAQFTVDPDKSSLSLSIPILELTIGILRSRLLSPRQPRAGKA